MQKKHSNTAHQYKNHVFFYVKDQNITHHMHVKQDDCKIWRNTTKEDLSLTHKLHAQLQDSIIKKGEIVNK